MPAVTLAQLQSALATAGASNSGNYLEPGANFTGAINEVGPRLYAFGYWRDLVEEQVYPGERGYIALDRDTEAVMSANINNLPQRVFSQFHDLANLGKTTFLPDRYGLIDLGYHPAAFEFNTIEDVPEEDVTPITVLHLVKETGAVVSSTDLATGTVAIVGETADGVPVTGTLTGTTSMTVTFSPGITSIRSIRGTSLPLDVFLRTTAADADTFVAHVMRGTDVVRHRRFRVGGSRSETFVHLLVKRAWTPVANATDIVYLGNLAAWKHALLGKLGEDNADIERSEYHWQKANQLLEQEIDAHRGAAIPRLKIDLYAGCAPAIQNLY